jgi:hypothetical protein
VRRMLAARRVGLRQKHVRDLAHRPMSAALWNYAAHNAPTAIPARRGKRGRQQAGVQTGRSPAEGPYLAARQVAWDSPRPAYVPHAPTTPPERPLPEGWPKQAQPVRGVWDYTSRPMVH